MKREKIIKQLSEFFEIRELVCPHVFERWGEKSWQFLATDFLETLLTIRRDVLNRQMICNSGDLTQRGLRCNCCEIVRDKSTPYLSAHILGQAGDFTVVGLSGEEARKLIRESADHLPHCVRLEAEVEWLHIDTLQQSGITEKVYEFRV